MLRLSEAAAAATSLPTGLPVAVGAADGPLGNLGTGAIRPGVAGLCLGTSGAVRMAVPKPSFDPAGRLFCYALTDDLWVAGGAVSNGGNTIRWAGETFAPDLVAQGHADEAVLELAAAAPAGSDGLLMLPYVLSERAPLWDPTLTGAFLGIRAHHGRGHFIRAALEGVCLQLYAIVDSLDSVAEVWAVRATGGPFRSNLWREVMAAVLGRPLSVHADAGGTALGAAALGWFALGGADSLGHSLADLGGPDPDATPNRWRWRPRMSRPTTSFAPTYGLWSTATRRSPDSSPRVTLADHSAARAQSHSGQSRGGQRVRLAGRKGAEPARGRAVGDLGHPLLPVIHDLLMAASDEVPPHDDLLTERLAAD